MRTSVDSENWEKTMNDSNVMESERVPGWVRLQARFKDTESILLSPDAAGPDVRHEPK